MRFEDITFIHYSISIFEFLVEKDPIAEMMSQKKAIHKTVKVTLIVSWKENESFKSDMFLNYGTY